jgi:superfamily II DNA or RNA helicase
MCREGLDIQSLNTIVLATSTGDVVQTCGRILRKEHAVSPLVIDIVDNFSTFVGQSKKRNMFYKKSEYAVHSLDFNYNVSNTSNCPLSLDTLRLSSVDLVKLLTIQVPEHEDEDCGANENSNFETKTKTKETYTFICDDDD